MPWVEKIAEKLPGWKAALMNRAGRVTLVRFVLSPMPIYFFSKKNADLFDDRYQRPQVVH